MPSPAPESSQQVLIIATGGTIAGTAASATDNVGYSAAQLTADVLVAAVPALTGLPIQTVQLAQLDSKDAGPALWQPLVATLVRQLSRADVAGIVITHGTDTLEETAALLQRVLAPDKPVVLTAAMRPATSLQADGPQNLLDAVAVARTPGARGVLVVLAGRVHAADAVRKLDAYRLDAFDSAPAGPVALVEEGLVTPLRPWPAGGPAAGFASGSADGSTDSTDGSAATESKRPALLNALLNAVLRRDPAHWPRVAWITSHAGFDAALVDAAVAAGFQGLVLAGTGNGSLHAELEAAAERAQQAGVALRLATRCASGRVVGQAGRRLEVGRGSGPAQARVHLVLDLLLDGPPHP
jgi:L-asparaginase